VSTTTAGKFNDNPLVQWVGLAFRLVLGGLFVYAGYIKLIDLDAARRSVLAYQLFPDWMAQIIGVALPILEVSIGLLLILGLFTRIASASLTLLLVIYIAGIISVWVRHIQIKCGCFSDGGLVTEWADAVKGYKQDILRDTLMALAAIWLVFFPVTALSVDRWLKGPKVDYAALETDADETDGASESTSAS
jgi:uncharacterized membrane protein YphA (DoxX/SURF4 family)